MLLLPTELWFIISRYLQVVDVVRAQMVFKVQMENPRILRLRYRYEPYTYKGIDCVYKNSRFVLKWNKMKIYDRHSLSNKQAAKSLYNIFTISTK
jgi:hypothetical protein